MMRYLRYLSSQSLDEGFVPNHKPGSELFYRTPDWQRYKVFKGHTEGRLTESQARRYDRHAGEITKLIPHDSRVLSLGGGTGSLEQRLARADPTSTFVVSDIYDREPVEGIAFSQLDMSDTSAVSSALVGVDTVLISNALSPLLPDEVDALFAAIGRSDVQSIIVYSAEDIRPLGFVLTTAKRALRPRRAMWLGYLYSSGYIRRMTGRAGFIHSKIWMPDEHGPLTRLWGSVYLAVLSRSPQSGWNIDASKLVM